MVQKYLKEHRPKKPPHDLMFLAPGGGVWSSATQWTKQYQVRLKWADIVPSRSKSAHQFRHLYAATSLSKGVPIDTLSHRMGHKDSSFTLERYIHILEEHDRTGVDELTSALVPPILLDQPYQREIF